MDLVIGGRHALFFDDDATASFVNSREALVPWNSDASLLIDRYDVRHLLDRIPPRPVAGGRRQRLLDDACDAVSLAEIDCERYKDLPASGDEGEEIDSETRERSDATGSGAYQAVPFSYGDRNTLNNHDNSDHSSGFRPPFEVPDFLHSHIPPTEKLHQIIARTAIFVSEHGRQSEIVLRVKQGDNPTFGFLMPDHCLHPYFQYLIDHPQILKHNTDSSKEYEAKLNEHASETGALSLLGSFYGNGDDDTSALKTENKETESMDLSGNAAIPVESEHEEPPPTVDIADKEATKPSLSSIVKEKKPLTVNKLFSGNVIAVAGSRKTGDVHSLTEKEQNFHETRVGQNPSIMEPPSFLKRTIEKIVEFIVKNGKQFEAILLDQDKSIGRFPFLLPTNQYYTYYLKILEEANEFKLQGKNLFDRKSDEKHHGGSKKRIESHGKDADISDLDLAEFSEGGYYDPQKKDKFKMVLVGQKKDSQDQSSKAVKQSGLSTDEAAAIVLAATRGASPANSFHNKSTDDAVHSSKNSGATVEEAAAIIMAATRGWSPASAPRNMPKDDGRTSSLSSLPGTKTVSRFASNGISSEKKNSRSTTSDVTVATVIAKSVALVASREADSSEAGLTKEQKLKAERLKRAKMFAALIKTGNDCMGEPVNSASNGNGSMEPPNSVQIGTDADTLFLEREGSSAPFAAEVSDREDESRKIHRSQSRAHHDDSDEDLVQSRKKKRHSSRRNVDELYNRNRSSKDIEARHRHKHQSSSNDERDEHDEHRHRRGSEHRRRRHRSHRHSSDDEDRELYEKRRRKQKRESEVGDNGKALEKSKDPSVSILGISDDNHPPATTDIPNDLRAKVRAMLLETL